MVPNTPRWGPPNMALNLRQCLNLPDIQQTARELGLWVSEQCPEECATKKESSNSNCIQTDSDLVQQQVAESSLAHFGYLVAGIVEGDGTLKKLRMLASAHGIGVIQLDVENQAESQILIPARERSEIDWDMCNRLTEENPDFAEFIGRIHRFHQTGEVSTKEWEVIE